MLTSLDQELFFLINQQLQNGLLDWLMPVWREKMTWIPLYVFFAFLAYRNLKIRGVWLIVAAIACAGAADFTSSSLIKPAVKRIRPCNDPTVKTDVRLLAPCGSGYSFTSSHATNHFALATFLFFTMGSILKKYKWTLFIWAALIGFAQIYVGVHYPFDVGAGTILGMAIGWVFAYFFERTFRLNQKNV